MAEYTEFALKALSLADLFNMVFKQERLGSANGSVNYRVELSAPDGLSTAGGKQALQHLKLIPDVPSDSVAVIVAGSASRADSRGEVRTFAHLQQLHARRYRGAPFPLDKKQYDEFLRKVERFFHDQNLQVVVLDAAPGEPVDESTPTEEGGTSRALMFAVGILVMLAVGGGLFFVLSSR